MARVLSEASRSKDGLKLKSRFTLVPNIEAEGAVPETDAVAIPVDDVPPTLVTLIEMSLAGVSPPPPIKLPLTSIELPTL